MPYPPGGLTDVLARLVTQKASEHLGQAIVVATLPHARRGKLKILAVFSGNRVPAADTIPTMAESGYPDAVAYSWFGIVAPAGTPTAIVNRLNKAINSSLQAPELRDRLRTDASSGPILSPEGYGDFMRKQAQIWEKVITPLKLEMTP